MFLRLFAIQAVVAAVLVGGPGLWFWGPAAGGRIALLAAAAALSAAVPAWLTSSFFGRPLRAIAERVDALAADGLGDKVYVGTGGQVRQLAQAVNLTSERLAEKFAVLEEDRRRLRGILDGMIEGVVALDADERVVFANDRAGLLLEFPTNRAVGLKLWEVVRQRPVNDMVTTALTSRAPCRAAWDRPGPAPRSLALYAAPAATGLILVIHDVTELRRLESLRQEFVANVSHELKTPLAVIKACVETLQDGAADDPVHRHDFLAQVDEQADRLHSLILDLLHLARIESGAEAFDPEAVPLDGAVIACIERHHARAEARRLSLAAAAPAEPAPAAWVDDDALAIILDNLVDNAIKYTPDGGAIEVRWGARERSVWLEVSDTGIGIGEADLPRVFERFYRVDKARSRELGGTGLGLSIVKHLAGALGGSVSARSRLGRGSAFTVQLPAAAGG